LAEEEERNYRHHLRHLQHLHLLGLYQFLLGQELVVLVFFRELVVQMKEKVGKVLHQQKEEQLSLIRKEDAHLLLLLLLFHQEEMMEVQALEEQMHFPLKICLVMVFLQMKQISVVQEKKEVQVQQVQQMMVNSKGYSLNHFYAEVVELEL
jgi:hypothetical protein